MEDSFLSRPKEEGPNSNQNRCLSQFTYYGPSHFKMIGINFVHPFTAGKLDVLIYIYLWYYIDMNMMSQMDLGRSPVFRHLYIYTYAHIGMDSLKGWDMTYDISKFSVWQDGEHRSLSASATEARCGMKWSFGGMLLAVRHHVLNWCKINLYTISYICRLCRYEL